VEWRRSWRRGSWRGSMGMALTVEIFSFRVERGWSQKDWHLSFLLSRSSFGRTSRFTFIQFLDGNFLLSYLPFLVLIDISLIISFINVNPNLFTSPEVSTVIHTCSFPLLNLSSNALYPSLYVHHESHDRSYSQSSLSPSLFFLFFRSGINIE
jgi:hypothetical protein